MSQNRAAEDAVTTAGLGKRFGSTWGLQDCTVSVPKGRVSALVGPNGAGKTTLLRMLVGLIAPTSGAAEVLGRPPSQTREFLASVGYLAQEVPLYKRLSAEEHLMIGRGVNVRWDASAARSRLRSLHIPLDRPVRTLSGGQRAQVGLGLALAKKPQVLLLDEPVAALDPLARRGFLASLAEAVAEGDLTVIMSSHLLHDLERVCDHVILLSASRAQLNDDIDTVVGTHRMLLGPRRNIVDLQRHFDIVSVTQTANQTRLIVRHDGPVLDPSWEVSEVGLEEIVLAYMDERGTGSSGDLVSIRAAS